jgi:DNA-binding transcriptional LysR family regulator
VLTDAGRALVAQARRVLAEADALQSHATAISGGLEPELAVAVDSLFPSGPLLDTLRGLRQSFPQLPVILYTEPISAAERRLRAGEADLALCAFQRDASSDLVAEPMAWIDMVPVVAAGHILAETIGPVSRRELEAHVQLILTDPGAPADAPRFGVISPRVWRFVEIARRLDFIAAGFGWANMPSHLVQPMIDTGQLARLTLDEPSLLMDRIPIFGVYFRSTPPGPAARWFLDRLKTACGGASEPRR